jgi:hypothetical protein
VTPDGTPAGKAYYRRDGGDDTWNSFDEFDPNWGVLCSHVPFSIQKSFPLQRRKIFSNEAAC